MIFSIFMDKRGSITGHPRSVMWRRRIAAHMKEMSGQSFFSFLIQNENDIEAFLDNFPLYKKKDLLDGFSASVDADPWEYAHYYGWDCHVLFERYLGKNK